MTVLQHRKLSPFGDRRIVDYLKSTVFQHRGSPHAHLLIWLHNDQLKEISEDKHSCPDRLAMFGEQRQRSKLCEPDP